MKASQPLEGGEIRIRDALTVKSNGNPFLTIGRLFDPNPSALPFDFGDGLHLLGPAPELPVGTALVCPDPVARHQQQTQSQQQGLSSHGNSLVSQFGVAQIISRSLARSIFSPEGPWPTS